MIALPLRTVAFRLAVALVLMVVIVGGTALALSTWAPVGKVHIPAPAVKCWHTPCVQED